ncbi:Hydrogenase 2 maturation protease [Pelotomaculum schinkii]|uniref:Hydrogenase 2 maturation protease n=1 Tax=Pelotomaculum schinkii TaxID=78350 RepID=A0A4Y7R8W0_9FIRM|nr:HyaD/HybD family hydrogenase maturation endopeptidase [Pelotomaculum schinkii]TEB05216.1 Hydrogenase 2 maturation protease [Pelotomaculum schinkii]
MDQENSKKVFVIGVGNLLLGDEGIGIHLIREMKKELLPRNVELVDGGTAGIDLLYWLEEADYAIIVDCVEAGAVPGAIFRVPGDELLIESTGQLISLHDINLSEVLLLATKMNKLPPTIIFGIQPEVIGYQTELSPTLQNTLPRLMQLIKKEILKIFA